MEKTVEWIAAKYVWEFVFYCGFINIFYLLFLSVDDYVFYYLKKHKIKWCQPIYIRSAVVLIFIILLSQTGYFDKIREFLGILVIAVSSVAYTKSYDPNHKKIESLKIIEKNIGMRSFQLIMMLLTVEKYPLLVVISFLGFVKQIILITEVDIEKKKLSIILVVSAIVIVIIGRGSPELNEVLKNVVNI